MSSRFNERSFQLETSLWCAAHYRKLFIELMNRSYDMIELEEHGVFLNKCSEIKVLPRRNQLYRTEETFKHHFKRVSSSTELSIAIDRNHVRLNAEKDLFVKFLFKKIERLNCEWQKTLMNEMIKETWYLRNSIKKRHYFAFTDLMRHGRKITTFCSSLHTQKSTNRNRNAIVSVMLLVETLLGAKDLEMKLKP